MIEDLLAEYARIEESYTIPGHIKLFIETLIRHINRQDNLIKEHVQTIDTIREGYNARSTSK